MAKKYDIFISYRRASYDIANLIAIKLSSAGYSVFIDIEALRSSGKFNEKLLGVIRKCNDFILVLPPNALDRCKDEADWVRQEVEQAIMCNKNIIPIMLRDFVWPPTNSLPETLRELPLYNSIILSDANLFIENIEKLKHNFLISRPRRKILHIALLLLFLIAVIFSVTTLVGRISSGGGEEETKKTEEAKMAELVCSDCAIQLTNMYFIADYNIRIIDDIYTEWTIFLTDYYNTNNKKYAIESFKTSLSVTRGQLMEMGVPILLKDDYPTLNTFGITCKDIDSFSKGLLQLNQDIERQFYIFESTLEYPKIYVEDIKNFKEYYMLSLKYYYYTLLKIYSMMPKSVRGNDDIKSILTNLEYFNDISMSENTEDYELKRTTLERNIEEKKRHITDMM